MFRNAIKNSLLKRMFSSSSSTTATYQACQQLYRSRKYEEALRLLDDLLSQHQQEPLAHQLKADILVDLGRLPEAKDVYDKIAALAPKSAETYYKKGKVLRKMGLLKEALQEYSQAIGINPECHQAKDERRETESELGVTLSKDPSALKRRYLEDAKSLITTGNFPVALKKLDSALQIDSSFVEALM